MRKLRLNLEQLTVETFQTAPATRRLGTVLGAQDYLEKEGELTAPTAETETCHTRCAQSNCGTWENTCPACSGIGCD
ncbi:MAG TPA: hypothetical protein VF006_03525 [Longimicrobium sp.]